MKRFLLFSAPYLLITSILISQPGENPDDHILSDLSLTDSTLNNLLKCPGKPDSRITGNLFPDSILELPDQNINDILKNGCAYEPYRFDNMPEYSFDGEYFRKMPEYHPDPDVTYIMPEAKFPGLIRNRSKLLQPLNKHKWESGIIK